MTDAAALLALTAVFAHYGKAATYAPQGGGASACKVITDNSDRIIQFGLGRGLTEGRIIEVRKSEIATVARGGVFVIEGETVTVIEDPQLLDPDRLVWTCRVESAP